MKKMFILAIIGLSSVAMANRESGGRKGASAVYIDFRSNGTGIDLVAANEVKRLIGEAGLNGDILDQTSEVTGREGETLECIRLPNAFKRDEFIGAIAPFILDDQQKVGWQRTGVYVGFCCGDLSSATEQDLSKYKGED